MKQNFTFTFCYFIYIGIAIFIHPAKSYNNFSNNGEIKNVRKQEVSITSETIDILHGNLLFKF